MKKFILYLQGKSQLGVPLWMILLNIVPVYTGNNSWKWLGIFTLNTPNSLAGDTYFMAVRRK
jgi:hypothetical protein